MIETKYAIIVNQETKAVNVGLGTNVKFYQSIGMTEMQVEQAYNGQWYVAGYAPQKPQRDVILEQINNLEKSITARNLRSAIQGDSFALSKIAEVETQIAELRKQL